jgi:signal transduction histidine kinase
MSSHWLAVGAETDPLRERLLSDRVEALGGTISIASPPRGGTTLSVRLPTTT